MLEYHAGDERPYWEPTVTVNGIADDMTSGFTFVVKMAATAGGTAVLTKTSGITGGPDGRVTVGWAVGELNLTPGLYHLDLIATRTSDSKTWTAPETVRIRPSIA